jgi:hypothetical protein
MNRSVNVGLSPGHAKRFTPGMLLSTRTTTAGLLGMLLVILAMMMPTPAHAVDGCKVLLCLAAPSWRSIPECVPTINQLHRDLARGKPFPSCSMAGAGNSANNMWASTPSNCPPQYTRVFESESGPIYSCDYSGAVTVNINGAPFTRTWWSMGGDTVTEFTPAAKTQLGTWDSKFDDDYAIWLASLPPPAPPCPTC